MLYSSTHDRIDTKFSYLETQRVFCGNYWDEFALPGLLLSAPAKVLFLGVGQGGGIRPVFASTPIASMDAVDLDAKSIEECSDLFKRHFPELPVRFHCASAEDYLANTTQIYDLIFIDLYSFEGPAPCLLDSKFLDLAAGCLSPRGILFQNVYGLPSHMSHETHHDLNYFNEAWRSRLGQVCNLPFRRNTSILASRAELSIKTSDFESPPLKPMDHLALSTMKARAANLQKTQVKSKDLFVLSQVGKPHLSSDQQMLKGWAQILEDLNGLNPQLNLSKPRDLLGLFADKRGLGEWIEEHRTISSKRAGALLALLAGEDTIASSDLKRHLENTLSFLLSWYKADPEFFFRYALPQVASCVQRREFGALFRFSMFQILSRLGEPS